MQRVSTFFSLSSKQIYKKVSNQISGWFYEISWSFYIVSKAEISVKTFWDELLSLNENNKAEKLG